MFVFRHLATRPVRLVAGIFLFAVLLAGCSGDIGSFTKFAPSKWGAASPRVTSSSHVPKGGGRSMVGQPYQVAGRWYTPRVDTSYDKRGKASWYGSNFHGRLTANGEIFDQNAITAAHPTLPLPSYVRVTNLDNGRSLIVRVNDRGPFVADRVIDLSRRSADMLGYLNTGVANVRVQYVGPAPLEGDDTRVLLASLDGSGVMTYGEAPQPAPARNEPALDTLKTLFTSPFDLFAYADGAAPNADPVNAAFAATESVALGADLDAWQQAEDIDRRQISAQIGVFADPVRAEAIARSFALIASVELENVTVGGNPAVSVRLSWLKPGATRADVIDLGHRLGLEDVAFDG